MTKALESANEADESNMEVDAEKTDPVIKLYVPTQKEVEEFLVKRRKQAILDRYVSEDATQDS
jgi:pre-mRNA-splicing factor ISY1